MSAWWARLGRPDAISGVVVVSVAMLQFVAGFVSISPELHERLGLFAVYNALSVAAVVATFVLGRHVIALTVADAVRPFATIIVLQLGALVRAITLTALLVHDQLTTVDAFWWRLFGAELNVFVTALVVSSLVTMARDHSETNQRLVDSLVSLTAARQQIESRVSGRERALVDSIRHQLGSALSAPKGESATEQAQTLQSLIDDVVRPISNRLGRELQPRPDAAAAATTVIDWSTVLRHTVATNPVHPYWTTLWFAVAVFQTFATTFGAGFLIVYLAAVTGFALWFAAGRWLWPRITQGRSLVTRAIIFTSIPIMFPIVVDVVAQPLVDGALLGPRTVVAQALWFTIVTWSVSLVISARAMLRQANGELRDAEQKLRRQLATENARARHVDEAVARVLHGPVQSAIAAALRRVRSFPEGHTITASELELIQAPIMQSLLLLDRDATTPSTVTRNLVDLVELWSGVVRIEVSLAPAAHTALDECPATSSAVIELLRELVSNAIRHGDASTITIDVTLDTAAFDIVMTVTNDGHPVDDHAIDGIGTRLLHGMSVQWSRANRASEVVVTAVVPLDAARETA